MSDTRSELDLIALVAGRWKTVAICLALGLGLSTLFAFLVAPWYSATLRVVPSQRSQDTAAMSLAARLPVGLDSLSTDVQRIQAVLNSFSVADEVIDRFNLRDHYGVKHREHARKALSEHCATTADRKSGVVSLTCEDKDPTRAMAMAEYFGEVGNRVFRRVSASSTSEERKFLEGQVVKAQNDVDDASRKLRVFQETHKVVDLPEQSKAVLSAMASIEGELISKQLELSYLTSFSARTESSVLQLRQQIGIMEGKLKQLEKAETLPDESGSAASTAGSADFFPGAMTVPGLRYELEQLLRTQKVRETVFFLMTQRFEMAKIDEARDTSTFQILDHPTLPTYKSSPKRSKLIAFGGAAGLAVAGIMIMIPAWWRRRKSGVNA